MRNGKSVCYNPNKQIGWERVLTDSTPSAARERLIDAAEELFSQRGYAAVRLRDIATRVGLHHASLYHHVPGGKEELFVEVTERMFERHRAGLEAAINGAGDDIEAQLLAAARWLLSQPPLDIARMVHVDLPEINPDHSTRLTLTAYRTLLSPLEQIFRRAQVKWGIEDMHVIALAGMFLSTVQGLHNAPSVKFREDCDFKDIRDKPELAVDVVKLFLYGIHPR